MEPITALTKENEKSANRRIVLLDILRGFALFGIIINHISMSFLAGPPPPDNPQFNILGPMDNGMNIASQLLTFGKFFTIFSFLFGLSFAIQLESAARKGNAFAMRFVWRLAILFAIGYVHNLFYSGDILIVYAALGLLLLPFRYLGNNLILPLALLLVLNLPAVVMDIIHIAAPPSATELAAQQEGFKAFGPIAAEQYRIKSSGTVAEVVQMNAKDGLSMKFTFQLMTGRLWVTFGLFLLGMYAGRKKIFDFQPQNQRFFRRLFLVSGITTLIATAAAMMLGIAFGRADNISMLIGTFAFNVHQAALSAFYASGLVLLYWKAKGNSRLNLLAPVGQMGLSTYLIQTVFGLLVFFGFGLGMMGKLGITASVGIGLAFFVVQIIFANWWMKRFRFGLVEWAWRSLTYFEVQPLRRRPEPVLVQEVNVAPSVVVVSSEAKESV